MSLWKQYKRDTTTYTTWLVDAAQASGYGGKIVYNAKGAINTNTIKNLSTHIGAQTSLTALTIVLPRPVWRAFKRMVNLRVQYSKWHMNNRPEEEEANAGHSAFIRILEQSASAFWDSVEVQPVTRRQSGQDNSTTTRMSFHNTFSSLVIGPDGDDSEADGDLSEEESVTPLGIPCGPQATIIHDPKIHAEEDCSFQKFCFMEDVVSYLVYIDTVWKRYFAGRMNLNTAAFITDATIEHVDTEEKELRESGVFDPFDLIYNHCEDEALRKMFVSLSDIHKVDRKNYFLRLPHLKERRAGSIDHKKTPAVDSTWENEDGFLAQLMMELSLECNARRNTWEKDNANPRGFRQPISRASLDKGSRVLESLLDGDSPRVASAFAARIIFLSLPQRQDQLGAPLAQLLETAEAIGKSMSSTKQAGVSFPRKNQPALDRCYSLVEYIIHWPLKEYKYFILRSLPEGHPLSGVQRIFEDHVDLSPANLKAFLKSLSYMPHHAVDEQILRPYENEFCIPSEEPDFLREWNQALSGILRLNLLIQREKAGLGFSNSKASVFAMCHLYNGLLQSGNLKTRWPLLENVIKIHIQTLFLGELPDTPESIYHRLLLSAGASMEMVVKTKTLRAKGQNPTESGLFKKSKKKTWDLLPTPITSVLGDYLDGKDGVTLRQTLSRMDAQMREDAKRKYPKSRKSASLLDDQGLIPYLRQLEVNFEEMSSRLEIDYISLTRACDDLFQNMDLHIKNLSGGSSAVTTDRGLGIAMSVLGELDDAEVLRKSQKTGSQTVEMKLTKIASVILEVHNRKKQKAQQVEI